jgi:hypothetical protein
MIQWPLRFVYPPKPAFRQEFWTLVGRQLQIDCKQINVGSANSGMSIPEILAQAVLAGKICCRFVLLNGLFALLLDQ